MNNKEHELEVMRTKLLLLGAYVEQVTHPDTKWAICATCKPGYFMFKNHRLYYESEETALRDGLELLTTGKCELSVFE